MAVGEEPTPTFWPDPISQPARKKNAANYDLEYRSQQEGFHVMLANPGNRRQFNYDHRDGNRCRSAENDFVTPQFCKGSMKINYVITRQLLWKVPCLGALVP